MTIKMSNFDLLSTRSRLVMGNRLLCSMIHGNMKSGGTAGEGYLHDKCPHKIDGVFHYCKSPIIPGLSQIWQLVLKMDIHAQRHDSWIWTDSKDGSFSFASTWNLARTETQQRN